MPLVIVERDKLNGLPRLATAHAFVCPDCQGETFTRDRFNPYVTLPDDRGNFEEHLLAKCSGCGTIVRWTFAAHVDDGIPPPEDWPDGVTPDRIL